jgi:type IV secretory pathway VirB4 component
LGAEGTYIGSDVFSGGSFVFDPWVLYRKRVLTNANILLAGVIGTGKSSTAKALATRSLALGRKVYVPSDPKGEWTPVTLAMGGVVIRLGPGLHTRLNPLDAGARPNTINPDEWSRLVWSRRRGLLGTLTESMLGRPMQSVEHTAVDVALAAACDRERDPTLPTIVHELFDPDAGHAGTAGLDVSTLGADGRQVAHALRRLVRGDLAGMFDGGSTTRFDADVPMISLDSSRIGAGGNDQALRLALACASAWLEAALTDPAGGNRFVIYDEGWRVMRDPALLRRMQEQWKLSRTWGISNMLIVHRLSDFAAVGDAGSEARALAEGLLADCSTRVMLRQESDQLARTASLLGLTDVEIATIADLPKGRALWRMPDRAFVVHLVRHAREIELFDTDGQM